MLKNLATPLVAAALAACLAACDSQHHDSSADGSPSATPATVEPAPETAPPVPAPREHPFAKPADYDTPAVQTTELPSGLKVEDLKVGDGPICLPKAVATFHYRAKPVGGAEFVATAERPDSDAPETQPMSRMMPGMKEGLVGMRVGGRRRLTIPSEMAFGFTGVKNPAGELVVQPDTPVVFVVDLIELKQGIAPPAPAAPAAPPSAPQ